jgi:putative ABC transport system permease protein
MFRSRKHRDFESEINGHLGMETERLIASRRWTWWDHATKDVQYAARSLRHAPGFTIAAVMTLALGIGANTAIFSVIDGALLRPLPYPDAGRLALIYGRHSDGDTFNLSPASFLDFKHQTQSFETLSAFRPAAFNLSGQDRPERVEGAVVTPDFFTTMGVAPIVGRPLTAEQDGAGGQRSVVLSYSLWRRRFGGDPGIVGRAVLIDGEPRTVAGVMPPSFQYPAECEAWTSARYKVPEHVLRPDLDQSNIRDSHYFFTIGRVRDGVSAAQAQAEVSAIAGRLARQYKEEEASDAAVVGLRTDLVGSAKPALLILLGAVSLLLALACANVANMLLARGAARQREMAVRAALGAGRGRLIGQMLAESMALGGCGAVLGVLLAFAAVHPLRALFPAGMTGGAAIQLDLRILVFTAAMAVAAALVFGFFPASQAAAVNLSAALNEGGRASSTGRRSNRIRAALVISEIALASVLLIGAGLLIRSLNGLLRVPEGFRAENVLTARLWLSQARYPSPADRVRFIRKMIDEMNALPGVNSGAVVSRLPLSSGASTRSLDVKGRTLAPGEVAPDYLVVTPDYFRSMGIELKQGRVFNDRDGANGPPVVIVNESAARHFWPGLDPVGQFVQVGGCGTEQDWCQVVGVAGDIRQHNLEKQPRPAVFVPYARDPWPFFTVVVRTSMDPASAASGIQHAIASVDKEQPVFAIKTMSEVVSQSLLPQRGRTFVLVVFAAVALALACAGIYGVISYSVTQRLKEFGVRIALGASRRDVLGLVAGQALKLALAGIAAGVVLSFALTRFLASLLYGVGAFDPATFLAVPGLLIGTTILSSYIPASRATRADPIEALRAQ